MNDTTKWIIIILQLLLIGTAVFMLLRSPGKENGAIEDRTTDRDGVPDARDSREGLGSGSAGSVEQDLDRADQEVYDALCPYPMTKEQPLFRGARGGLLRGEIVRRAVRLGLSERTTPHP